MDSQPMLDYDVVYPERLSRLLIFVKWLLAIPHIIVLALLGVGLAVTTIIAWFAILITGKYPRGLWDFAVIVIKWQARVNIYVGLQRDEYPPFGDGDYPMRFDFAYPEHLSRGLIFIKWLLVIPHLIIVYFLQLAQSIVGLIAWFAILFTGRYPEGMFSFYSGCTRWSLRASVYVLLLTDAYPPFNMDQAGMPPSPSGMAPNPSF